MKVENKLTKNKDNIANNISNNKQVCNTNIMIMNTIAHEYEQNLISIIYINQNENTDIIKIVM